MGEKRRESSVVSFWKTVGSRYLELFLFVDDVDGADEDDDREE